MKMGDAFSEWWYAESNGSVAAIAPLSIQILVHEHWDRFPAVHPIWHYVLGVVYIVLGLTSLSGQTLVLFLFFRTKSLRTPANVLVVNLAFSDFMMMITQFPVFVYNCFAGGGWRAGVLLCELTGFAGGLFGYSSIWTHAAIAIDRYNVIVRGFAAAPLTHVKAIFFVMFVWAWSLLWSLPPFFGWGKYVPEGILNSCSFDYLTRDMETMIFILCCWICEFATPLTIIIICYVFIVKAVWDHEKQLRDQAKKMNVVSLRTTANDKKMSSEMQIAKVALVNVLLWIFSWTPYATVAMIGIAGDQMLITPLRSALPALAGKAASVYNPIVYAISHPKFKQALEKEMRFCRKVTGNDNCSADAAAVSTVTTPDT